MKIKCLLIDDEPIAREILESYIEKAGYLEVKGMYGSAIEAFEYLQTHPVELIFLDIQMPEMSGLQFLKTLSNPPKVILTTAYREYAVDSYELNVIDYLVKPISFDRFMKAIGKVVAHNNTSTLKSNLALEERPFIFLKGERKLIRVYLDEIIYLESQRDYVLIVTTSTNVKTRHTLQYFEELLPQNQFIRIHRSFMIAVSKIQSISENRIEAGGKELTIGGNYKQAILDRLNIK